jgi:hypothetical protein
VRKVWIILLLALCATIGLVVWNQKRTTHVFTLKDGNRLTFRGATAGTNTAMHFGPFWERALSRLPGKYGSKARANSWTDDGSRDALVLWFTFDRAPPPDAHVDVQFEGRLMPGFQFNYWLPPRGLANGEVITFCGSPLWPRRDKTITAEVSYWGPNKEYAKLGSFTLPNPNYGTFPEWTPEALPAVRTVGEMTFELATLRAHRPPNQVGSVFRVKRNGQPDSEWELCSYQVSDATGNVYQSQPAPPEFTPRSPRAYANSNGVIMGPFPAGAWPREKAWKFGVEFVRSRRFESNEIFVLTGVPVKAAGGRTTDTWWTNLPVGLVELKRQPDWNKPNKPPRIVTSELERSDFSGAAPNPLRVFLLEAVTDDGKKLEPFDQRRLDVPPDSKTVDITVAVPKRCFVEYLIDPAILRSTGGVPVWRD